MRESEDGEDFSEACKNTAMRESEDGEDFSEACKNTAMRESEDGEESDEFQESNETVTEITDEEYKEAVPGIEDKPTFEDNTDTYVDAEACNKDESFKESVPGITEQPDYTENQVEVRAMVPEADPVGI